MMSRLALRLVLRIVRAVAMLVPVAGRADWKREWDAELLHHSAHLRPGRNPARRALRVHPAEALRFD